MASGRGVSSRDTKRWTEDEAREHLRAWRESGESVAAFARQLGVTPQRLFWWRRRLGERASPSLAFVPVVVRQDGMQAEPAIVVVAASGTRVEVRDADASTAAWVAAFVRAERSS